MIEATLHALQLRDPFTSAEAIAVTFIVLMIVVLYGVGGFMFGIAVGMARRRKLHATLQAEADALHFLRANRFSLQVIQGIWAVTMVKHFEGEKDPRTVLVGQPSFNMLEAIKSAQDFVKHTEGKKDEPEVEEITEDAE